MTEDFIYIEHEWGSLFFKHLGKMKRNDAKEKCSDYGESVHLPLPRFPTENEFYQNHFGNESLWLGLSDAEQDGLYTTDYNATILHFVVQRPEGEISGSKYKWTNRSLTLNSDLNGVILSNNGYWLMEHESKTELDSICVYNIIPDECEKCPDKNFCRYTDRSQSTVECICPAMNEGGNCERSLCKGLQCLNGGQCYLNDQTRKTECFCPYPFHGKECESGKNYSSFVELLYYHKNYSISIIWKWITYRGFFTSFR